MTFLSVPFRRGTDAIAPNRLLNAVNSKGMNFFILGFDFEIQCKDTNIFV
jgi:hypothetical protein